MKWREVIEESHEINLSIYLKKREILYFFPEYIGMYKAKYLKPQKSKKQNIAAITLFKSYWTL